MELPLENIFCDIKECLLYFKYPLAHCMSDNELGDVFHESNRCFLVSWMLKLYLGDLYQDNLNVTEKEKNSQMMADLLHELGFCMKAQSLPFMKGDLNLEAEIEILYNIFKFIKSVKSSTRHDNTNPVSNDEIMILSHNELNLFPMYGDIKMSNNVETFSNAIEIIQLSNDRDDATLNEKGEDIEFLLEQVHEELGKMELVSRTTPKTTNDTEKDPQKIEHHPDSSKILRICVDHTKQISQLLQDLNTIQKFKECSNISKKEWTSGTDDSRSMLRALYEEIILTMRYQRMKLS